MQVRHLVSVIIPIYNLEKYLKQCIESVINQDYPLLEIILVDDGSEDESSRICDSYSESYSNVVTIHKDNGGLSDARNVGIKNARGSYVLFLDSDDFWDDPQAVSRLMARQMRTYADVINFSYVYCYENTQKKTQCFKNTTDMPIFRSLEERYEYLTTHGLYIASACNKLIRKEIISEFEFRKGVYSEDIEWCARLLLKAKCMDFVCENFYMYRQHSSSIHRNIGMKNCDDLANNILACFELLSEADVMHKNALLHYTAYQYGTFFIVQAQSKEFPVESIERLAQYSWILKYHGKSLKLLVLRIGCNVFGYKKMCAIVRFWMERLHRFKV